MKCHFFEVSLKAAQGNFLKEDWRVRNSNDTGCVFLASSSFSLNINPRLRSILRFLLRLNEQAFGICIVCEGSKEKTEEEASFVLGKSLS